MSLTFWGLLTPMGCGRIVRLNSIKQPTSRTHLLKQIKKILWLRRILTCFLIDLNPKIKLSSISIRIGKNINLSKILPILLNFWKLMTKPIDFSTDYPFLTNSMKILLIRCSRVKSRISLPSSKRSTQLVRLLVRGLMPLLEWLRTREWARRLPSRFTRRSNWGSSRGKNQSGGKSEYCRCWTIPTSLKSLTWWRQTITWTSSWNTLTEYLWTIT